MYKYRVRPISPFCFYVERDEGIFGPRWRVDSTHDTEEAAVAQAKHKKELSEAYTKKLREDTEFQAANPPYEV